MKRLYKRLAATFLFSAVLTVLIFAVSLYKRGVEENGRYLNQLLTSVEANLGQASQEYEENLEHLAEDYINRARAVEYIAAHDTQMIDRNGLEILKGLMKAGEISLIDSEGAIFLSTSETLQGIREEEALMEELKTAAEGESTAVRIDRADFQNRPEYFYAAAGSQSERFAAVRIDADMSRTGLLNGKEVVGTILKQATTEYETSIFAVGKERGRVFGITENNSQEIRLKDVSEGEEMLDYLARLPKGEPVLLSVNGAFQSAVVRELDEMYLVAFSGMNRVLGNIFLTFWIGLAVIGFISVLTVLMVRHHLKKYLFSHFEQITEEICRIIRGGRELKEDGSEIPELRPLMEMIFQLEREYVEKSQGMDRMEDQLSAARTEADYDPLTGLYNRNGFERRAEAFLKEEHPGGALILFDLDNFKQINDFKGHPEGDRALQKFAQCLSKAFRKEDVTGRLGGDEFVVLVCNSVSEEILEEKFSALLEDIRSALKEDYDKYRVSASIGAVPVDGSIRDYRHLYQCADTALYISKYLGKDRFYINSKMINCMRRECIGCRSDCPRSRILGGDRPDERKPAVSSETDDYREIFDQSRERKDG